MKVLQISPVAPPYRAGMANAAGEIFKATREANIATDLVAAFGESSIKNLKHIHLPGFGLLAFTPRLVSLCGEYDLVHLHYPCYGNAMMVALSRVLGNKKPLVVSYHMDTAGRRLRKPVFAFHNKFLAPVFLRQAAAIVVASRDYAEHSLLAKYPELMKKVVEIPFGIDTTRFCPAGQKRVGGKNIIFVGGLDEQHYFKGLHVLLEALVKIPDARLTVVGSGNLVKFYARRAFDLAIDERVIFAGKVSDEELPGYYQNADVFCLPSLDRSEAFGMVVLEASASGLPAVVSDIPGVRTAVKNNETGLLVPPGDVNALANALNSILSDSQLATRLGAAGREFALSRSWKKAGEAYGALYRDVLRR
jgi:glycosyltransferase involved in cell wall biosynthesis